MQQCIFREEARNTSLTRAFTGRLAGGISNRFAAEMKAHEAELVLYPAVLCNFSNGFTLLVKLYDTLFFFCLV
jgi:hypothetical protein